MVRIGKAKKPAKKAIQVDGGPTPVCPSARMNRLSRTRRQYVPFASPVAVPEKKGKKEKKPESTKTGGKKTAKGKKTNKVETKKDGQMRRVKGGKVTKKDTKKADKKFKEAKVRKIGNDRLVARDNVEQYKENPFVFGKTTPEYVSGSTLHRHAIRALKRGDMKEFKKIVGKPNFPAAYLERYFSYGINETATNTVIMSGDSKLIGDYFTEVAKLRKLDRKVVEEPNLLERKTTGRRNFHMLGRATRVVQISRGAKEGNNALIDYAEPKDAADNAGKLVQNHVEFAVLDKLKSTPETGLQNALQSKVVEAVRFGQREVASKLIELCANWDFNELHKATLKKDGKPPKKILPISVRKKAHDNRHITPAHTAAINNNTDFLKAMRVVEPNINLVDLDNWSTAHYAAVCDGSNPLKYLLSLDTPLLALNKQEETPLHCAARAGRVDNVKIILDWIDKYENSQKSGEVVADEEEDEEVGTRPKKAKKAQPQTKSIVNYKNKIGRTALHMAVKYERLDVIRLLLKHTKCDIEAQTNAGDKKMSPLGMACQIGALDVVKCLVEEGKALIESKDKLRRSPLLHAVMNGQDHVVAYLLQKGADLHKPDSSGNSPAHYAAAYGFLSTLQVLCDVDGTCLASNNDWLLTPLSVAYLKGHYGIVSWMLDGPHSAHVNINCKDNEGATLMSSLLAYFDTESASLLPEQIKFLCDRGADCSLEDSSGSSPLHIFAALQIPLTEGADKEKKRLTVKQYIECVDMLLKGGSKITQRNSESDGHDTDRNESPFQIALTSGNLILAELLYDKADNKEHLLTPWTTGSNVIMDLMALPFKVFQTKELWAEENGATAIQYDVRQLFRKVLGWDAEKAKEWLWEKFKEKPDGTPVTQLAMNYFKLGQPGMKAAKKGKAGRGPRQYVPMFGTPAAAAPAQFDDTYSGTVEAIRIVYLELLKICVEFNPRCIMQTDEIVLPGQFSLVHIAVNGVVDAKEENQVLDVILESAHKTGRLHELLCVRDADARTPLQAAILTCNETTVCKILDLSKRFSYTDKVHNAVFQMWITVEEKPLSILKTILHLLVERQMVAAIKHLHLSDADWKVTDKDPSLVLTRRASTGNSAFHYACRTLNTNTVTILKLLRVPNETGHYGQTPLHVAVDAERTYSADAFIEPIGYVMDQMDVNAQDKRGRTALHYALSKKAEDAKDQCDPIAVVSLLLGGMKKEAIKLADKDGNTALHLAAMRDANICAVTLMNHGCEISPVNNEGNTPLGLAVLNKWPQTALTLIQAHSDIHRKVFGPVPTYFSPSEWAWFAEVKPQPVRLETNVPGLVVKNEWHSMVYVILDLLEKTPATVGELARAALSNGQHNFSLYLLKMLATVMNKENNKDKGNIREIGLLTAFVEGLNTFTLDTQGANVLDTLLEMDIEWLSANDESTVMEAAARKGLWKVVEQLKNDPRNGAKQWEKLSGRGKALIFSGLVEFWIEKSGNREELKKGMAMLADVVVMSTNVPYPKPELEGLTLCKNPPTMQDCTPYKRAIQAQDPSLIAYLYSLKCTFPSDSLMLAVSTNQRGVVKAVCEGEVEMLGRPEEKKEATVQGNGGMFGFMVGKTQKRKSNGFFFNSDGVRVKKAKRAGAADDSDEDSDEDAYSSAEDSEDEDDEEETTIAAPTKDVKLGKLTLKMKNKDIKLDATDADGRNVFHYLVHPVGWENLEMLQAVFNYDVVKSRKLLAAKDRFGESPMQLAAKLLQRKIVAQMNKLVGGSTAHAVCKVTPRDVSVLQSQYHVDEDARHFLDDFEKTLEAKKQEETEEEKAQERIPHHLSDYESSGEIVRCPETGQLFKVVLNKTDIQYGTFGFHNFYRMQLIKRKDCDLFILFTNWGRIGDKNGEHQQTPFTQLDKAIKEFKSVWRQKTGQDWKKFEDHQDVYSKYRLVQTSTRHRLHKLPIDIHSHDSGDEVYKLVKDISDVKSLGRYAKTVRVCNAEMQSPLGNITKESIAKAREVLKDLWKKVEELIKLRAQKQVSAEKCLEVMNEQRRLSSEFYSLIPLGGFEQSALPVLERHHDLQNCEKSLDDMQQIEVATRVLCAATWRKKECESIRYIQYALECDFRVMSPHEEFSQRVLQYARVTSRTNICGIIEITCKNAYENYGKFLNEENQMFLWHGTKAENLISILKNGLMAVPSNAMQCGQAYGKGVYFADSFAKSEGYSQPAVSGVNYMLLCQVAIGKMVTEVKDEKYNFDTLYVSGNHGPDMTQSIRMDSGVVMPLGPHKEQDGSGYWGDYSEYVVQDNHRSMPKYLVMYK